MPYMNGSKTTIRSSLSIFLLFLFCQTSFAKNFYYRINFKSEKECVSIEEKRKYLEYFSNEIYFISNWLNIAFINADEKKLNHELKRSLWIEKAYKPGSKSFTKSKNKLHFIKKIPEENFLAKQQKIMSFKTADSLNLSGKGITIAVFDAGFPNVDNHPAFRKLLSNRQIIATYDFTKNDSNVFCSNSHGQAVLSNICGITENNQKIGLATDAKILLAITEEASETIREEEYFLAATEWAASKGADIISCSLGYTFHRYFQDDMNGKTSIVALAVNKAAEKGIAVFISAGNDGRTHWNFICTPADAENGFTVGGIHPLKNYAIGFSSKGFASLKYLKPEICAPALTFAARGRNSYGTAAGTSFSAPLVAGMAACILEWKPELKKNPLALKKYMIDNATLFPYYDLSHGYGIPQFFKISNDSGNLKVCEQEKQYDVLLENLNENKNLLFYKYTDLQDNLKSYGVIKVKKDKKVKLKKIKNRKLHLFYNDNYWVSKG